MDYGIEEYEIQISRGCHWLQDVEPSEIPKSEWEAFIASEPDVEPISEVAGRDPLTGDKRVVSVPSGARFGAGLVMSWSDGKVSAPFFEELIDTYHYVADKLSAQIYDWNGEKL